MAIKTLGVNMTFTTSSTSSSSGSGAGATLDLAPPPCDCDCDCDCGCTSEKPVRYFNGELQLSAVDLAAAGFGDPLVHRRVYSNRLPAGTERGQGYNWLSGDWPYLVKDASGHITFIESGHEAVWFNLSGGSFTSRYAAKHTLTLDNTNHVYTLVTPQGEQLVFHDFVQGTYPQGLLKSRTSPGGVVTSVAGYSAQNRVTELSRAYTSGGNTTTDSLKFDYFTSGAQLGRLQYATLRRRLNAGSWNEIRRAEYEYCSSSDSDGSEGDLRRVKIQTLVSSTWTDLETTYYRYHKAGDVGGAAHLLKYVFLPESYRRLKLVYGTPTSASDGQVAPYADYYFAYDGANRVREERVEGGGQTCLFDYTANRGSVFCAVRPADMGLKPHCRYT